MNYYKHPYTSNSDLSALKLELMGEAKAEYIDAYRIGSLIDAMITEPERVDLLGKRLLYSDYYYNDAEIEMCKRMKAAFFKDSFCFNLFNMCKGQSEFYIPNKKFTVNGIDFDLNCKCKYDLWSKPLKWGGDIKSTTATTQAQFEAAVKHFDYDRQRYWYMNLSGAKQDMLIGISKKNCQIFKIPIKVGDPLYNSGKAKAEDLAFKFWALKSAA